MIALVVTIIVLLILAAVAINLTIGDNGIFTRAQDATKQWDKASVEEELNLILAEYPIYKLQGGTDSLEDFLLSKGADSVTNNGDGTLDVEYKGYIFTIDEDTLKILDSEELGGVKPEIEMSKQASSDQKSVTITVTVTNNVGTVDSIELYGPSGEQITGNLNGKTATFTVNSNGEYTTKVKATTDGKQRSASGKIEVNEIVVEFSTKFGRIEVIWIDQQNNVIENPLSPESSLMGMTPVKWEGTTESTAKSDNSDGWYNYVAGTGTEDNLNSHWANAKDGDNYFVWIPRYAYRITYYNNSDVVTGYYDGRGMVDTQGNQKYALDAGVETVESNGKSYIVHPAFETNLDLGGWSGDLAGIWVGKYETSGSSSDMKIIPNTPPIKTEQHDFQSAGRFYTYGQNYDRAKESHLMKNSEWGAVAYLTHSQYGRNGNEIYINNSYTKTGNSGGSTDASSLGTKYEYNTPEGQKASSTGNIYGIYDLSGGCSEHVAAFDNSSNSLGNSFASKNAPSTQYATAYTNGTDVNSGEKIYEIGKTGDATKEVYTGNGSINWNNDTSKFVYSGNPFFVRGGAIVNGKYAGVFQSDYNNNSGGNGFRVVLVEAGT